MTIKREPKDARMLLVIIKKGTNSVVKELIESECALRIEGEKIYCPNHPDIVACVDFLHNATNKGQGQASTDTTCAQSFVTCLHESNPEKYCLNSNDPAFCKTIGDLCDADGFVRPEYPYCKSN